jgi:hypothetical protein
VHLITLLEAEELEHMQDVHTEEEKVYSLEAELESLKLFLQKFIFLPKKTQNF